MLNKVFAEEREFVATYAPIVRKRLVKTNTQTEATPAKQEVQFFDVNSDEFANALRHISPEILDLLKGQFNASPTALLRGAFKDEDPIDTTTTNDDSDTSAQFTEETEEDDDSDE